MRSACGHSVRPPFSSLQTYSTCASLRSLTFLLHHVRSFEKNFPSGSFLQDALSSVLCLAQCSKAPSPSNGGETSEDTASSTSYKARLTRNHPARPRSSTPSPLPARGIPTGNACGPCLGSRNRATGFSALPVTTNATSFSRATPGSISTSP